MAEQETASSRIEVPEQRPWPELPADARYGIAGRFLRAIEPHTEADPAGVLLQFLVMVGNMIGRSPHFRVEADHHHLNLFAILVGESAKGRKGVSAGQATRLLRPVDAMWCKRRMLNGLSSGEGLIWAVRDPIEKTEAVREKGRPTGEYVSVVVDEGETDKRLFVLEAEFASILRVLNREGNTLSATIRTAWDSGDLRTLTKNSPAVATGAHISIVGHITRSELLRYLNSTETANGFGNRFLWCCVRRSKFLPEGGDASNVDFGPMVEELRHRVTFARQTGEIVRDAEARELWSGIYPDLSRGKPGLLGSIVGRAEAQTMRLACLYALLDHSPVIRAEHLMAALALWTYCEASATWIFGGALGDPVADELARALRQSPDGLTKTEIASLFGRHRRGPEIGRALGLLLEQGLATFTKEATDGRPVERWRAADGSCEKSELSEKSP
ncbi:MAG: DUF3987 domain-containing protein [Thermoanaerobaculia bacterium]|nr:DUF3987 domain-containing protein [Thermoanaerobaculia bacterium]